MCGRYSLYSKKEVYSKFNFTITPNYNISPGSSIPVLDENFNIKMMHWGLNETWLKNKSIINARLESINNKFFFSKYRRCIFIADGYIEWMKVGSEKIPYFHHFKNKLMYIAGLYNNSNAVIITIRSNQNISHIHNRQPLIIDDNSLYQWSKRRQIIANHKSDLNYYEVSKNINFSNNNYKELLNKIN